MDRLVIASNFRIFVPATDGRSEERRDYGKGMVVAVADIPAGHTAEAWIAKGLATAAPAKPDPAPATA